MDIFDWSTAAGSNGFAAPNGFPEGMNYSDVNNSAREIMAVLARWYADTNGSLVTGGAGNAYTITPNRTVSAYVNGLEFGFRADRANTGAVTLNVSAVGASNVVHRDGSDLAAGEIRANGNYRVTYNSTLAKWVIGSQIATAAHRGEIEIATDPEAIAGTDGTRALVPSNFAQSSHGTSGYQKLPGGLILQWGQVSVGDPAPDSFGTWNYPIAFPNNVFQVYISLFDTSGALFDISGAITAQGLSSASFTVQEWSSVVQNCTAKFFAIGK